MKNTTLGIIGGAVVYALCIAVGYLGYFQMPYDVQHVLLVFFYVMSVIASLYTLWVKERTMKGMVYRLLIQRATFWTLTIFNGSIGTFQLLDKALHIVDTEANSRAAGLGMGLFLIAHLITILICSIIRIFLIRVIAAKKA